MPKKDPPRTEEQQDWLRKYFFGFGMELTESDGLLDINTKAYVASIKRVRFNAAGIAKIEITAHSNLRSKKAEPIETSGPLPI